MCDGGGGGGGGGGGRGYNAVGISFAKFKIFRGINYF